MPIDFAKLRHQMVEEQLIPRGIKDLATLASMRKVPRHEFVLSEWLPSAYADNPLPIGYSQTISQPYIVGLMIQGAELDSTCSVLEVGTGSGYCAAVLSQIVQDVYTIERLSPLAEQAKGRFEKMGYHNIHVLTGDGSLGWPEHAPYDAIIVTAGAPVLPDTLVEQLKVGGRLLIPVGDECSQQLLRVRKKADGSMFREVVELVRFVPLIGEEGWHVKE